MLLLRYIIRRNERGSSPASVRGRRQAAVVLARRAGAVREPAGRVEARRVSRAGARHAAGGAWAAGRDADAGGGAARRLCPARGGSARERRSGARGGRGRNIGDALARGVGDPRHVPAPRAARPVRRGASGRRRRLPALDLRRCTRARPSTQSRAGAGRRFRRPARARERAARRRRGRAHRPARPRRAPPARPRARGPDVDLARGGLGDARCRRGSALGDRAARGAGARAAVLGGREAGGRERRRHRRDQSSRDRPRASDWRTRRARRAPLAGHQDDLGRDRPRRAVDPAGSALSRPCPEQLRGRGRARSELEPTRPCDGAGRPSRRAGRARLPAARALAPRHGVRTRRYRQDEARARGGVAARRRLP